MPAEPCWRTPELDAGLAVARFLDEFTGRDRAEAVHLALKQLRQRAEPDRVLACELAWEAHTGGYWSQLRDEADRPYESEEAYFRDVLGLASWRTAYKRLAIGRMLTTIAEPERALVRAAVADVGLAKATIIAPAIERTGEWQAWAQLARQMPAVTLQLRVSEALQASPRGREPSPPGERFRRSILSAMPDIDAMEVVERFFDIGQRVVGTDHPVGIFLAGCRECLADWEVHAAAKRRAKIGVVNHGTDAGNGDFAHVGKGPAGPGGSSSRGALPAAADLTRDDPGRDLAFCPRGQRAPDNGARHP